MCSRRRRLFFAEREQALEPAREQNLEMKEADQTRKTKETDQTGKTKEADQTGKTKEAVQSLKTKEADQTLKTKEADQTLTTKEGEQNLKTKHSQFLFVDQVTSAPIRFCMRPSTGNSSEKAKLRPLIEHGGGILSSKFLPNSIRLVEPGCKVLTTDENTVTTQYIWDCVNENKQLDKRKYLVQINSLNVSDISNKTSMSTNSRTRSRVVKTERNLKPRREYTREDDKKILDYIIRNKRYSDVKGIMLWQKVASTSLLDGRSAESLREHWRRQIAPNLRSFKLTDDQMRRLKVEEGSVTAKARRKYLPSKKKSKWMNKNDEVITLTDESDYDLGNCSSADSQAANTNDGSYTGKEVWAIFRYIFNNFDKCDIKGDTMWEKMETYGVTRHSRRSMKHHFFDQMVPNIHSHNLPKNELKRLSTMINIPKKEDADRSSSSDDDDSEHFSVDSLRKVQLRTDNTSETEEASTSDADDEAISENDTRAIFEYIFRNFVYEDVTSDVMWLKMELEKVTRHKWHAMKDHFYQNMMPNIHSYRIPKLHLKRLASVLTIPDAPKSRSLSRGSRSSEETGTANNSDNQEECDVYTDGNVQAMLKIILETLGKFQLKEDTLWKSMELTSVTPHTWKSMKDHFHCHLLPEIHKHNLSKQDLTRLGKFVQLPNSPGSTNPTLDKGSTSKTSAKDSPNVTESRTRRTIGANETAANQSSPSRNLVVQRSSPRRHEVDSEIPRKTRKLNEAKNENPVAERRSPRRIQISKVIGSPEKSPMSNAREKSQKNKNSETSLPKSVPVPVPEKRSLRNNEIGEDSPSKSPKRNAGHSSPNTKNSETSLPKSVLETRSLGRSEITQESLSKSPVRNAGLTSPNTKKSETSLPKSVPETRLLRRSEITRESPSKSPLRNAEHSSPNTEKSETSLPKSVLETRLLRRSKITRESLSKSPLRNAEHSSPNTEKSETSLGLPKSVLETRSLRSCVITQEKSPVRNAGLGSPNTKNSKTSLPKSPNPVVVQTSPCLTTSEDQSSSQSEDSQSKFTSEVNEDDGVTETDSLSSAPLHINSLRKCLGAKLSFTSSSSHSSSSPSIDGLDEQLLGNLQAPILRSMKRKIQIVLGPRVTLLSQMTSKQQVPSADVQIQAESNNSAIFPATAVRSPRSSHSASPDISSTSPKTSITDEENFFTPPEQQLPQVKRISLEATTTKMPIQEDSNDGFKVPKNVTRSPLKKRNGSTDICATVPKTRLTDQENSITSPGQKSTRSLTLAKTISLDAQSCPMQEEAMTNVPIQEDSNDVFKVPENVTRSPRRKRNGSTDVCTTVPKARLTDQENTITPPGQQSPQSSTLVERIALDASGSNPAMPAGAEKDSANSIVMIETVQQEVGEIVEELGKLFASSLDLESTKQKVKEQHEKLQHLNKAINRALLSARLERIIDKSPSYMSSEDKLAIHKFVNFAYKD